MTEQQTGSIEGVLALLLGQHDQIETLFEWVLATSGDERADAFFELRRLLAVHEAAEEVIVHPRARKIVPGGDDLIDTVLDEEEHAKIALGCLEDLDLESAEFTAAVTELRDAVLTHVQREENDEFPHLGNCLDADELDRMASAVEFVEKLAPTRPHPGVESRAANLVVGTFAAMIDKARDAIERPGP